MSSQLELDSVSVAYGKKSVVHGVSIALEEGEIGCLLGPSGCGKTTLLRAIAGFESPTTGRVRIAGREVANAARSIPPEMRRVGMVFQDFALFPHLTVGDNVAFGLRRLGSAARRQRVSELLAVVGLEANLASYPHELSGGQQQRVALARAMAPRPEILLLDEPFSSLDVELREQLAREVRELLNHDQITAIVVTHDQIEAFAIADRIGVMSDGRLHQWASGYDLYHRPVDRFVADFIGQGVMMPGRVRDGRILTELGLVRGDLQEGFGEGDEVEVLLRPDDVIHDDASPLRVEVTGRIFRGAEYLYTLRLPSGHSILCLVQSHHDHPVGARIGIRLDVEHLALFPQLKG
jgi:iron(III) transport system ATP-binding protein